MAFIPDQLCCITFDHYVAQNGFLKNICILLCYTLLVIEFFLHIIVLSLDPLFDYLSDYDRLIIGFTDKQPWSFYEQEYGRDIQF